MRATPRPIAVRESPGPHSRQLAVLGYARRLVTSPESWMAASTLSRVLADVRERIARAGSGGPNEQNTEVTMIGPALRATMSYRSPALVFRRRAAMLSPGTGREFLEPRNCHPILAEHTLVENPIIAKQWKAENED